MNIGGLASIPTNSAPRQTVINGQPHMLSYINPEEAQLLKDRGGSGRPSIAGIPAFYTDDSETMGSFGSGADYSAFDGSNDSNDSSNDILSAGAAEALQQQGGRENYKTDISMIGGGGADYGVTGQNLYDASRGATSTNPFPESFVSQLGRKFGFDVRYDNLMNQGNLDSVNNLRYRQSQDPGKFKPGDFYIGQPTTLGEVKELPSTGVFSNIINNIPGPMMAIRSLLTNPDGLPVNDPRYIEATEQAKNQDQDQDTNIFSRIANAITGESEDRIAAAAMPQTVGNPDTRTFDAFGNTTTNFYNNPLTPETRNFQDELMLEQSRNNGIGSLPQSRTLAEANTNNFSYTPTQQSSFIEQLLSPKGYNIGSEDFPINLNTRVDPFNEEIGARIEIPFNTG